MSRLPNEDAMERYFSALLDEPKVEPQAESSSVNFESLQDEALRSSTSLSRAKPDAHIQRLLDNVGQVDPTLELQPLTQLEPQSLPSLSVDSLLEEVDDQLGNLVSIGAVLPDELVFAEPEPEPEPEPEVIEVVESQTNIQAAEEIAAVPPIMQSGWRNIEPEEEFQALFFEVAGISFAVMLTELGGIHKIDNVTSLFGKPPWFSGIMTQRDKKLNVVDTAKWVMTDNAPEEVDYKYLILLGDTQWGLSCCSLIGTEKLTKDQVKWRNQEGKRPWLAGMVKKKMCALLHVSELVKLLSRGVNIEGI